MKGTSSITRLMTVASTIVLLAIAVLAQSPASQGGQEKTLTGIVSDNMCGATHMLKDKTAAECTRLCVKQGSKYALVVGQKVYMLEGHEPQLDKLAGTHVTVKGRVSGDTVAVESVGATKG